MADMSDLQGWAQRSGAGEPGEPGGGGEQPAGEGQEEPQAPPCEIYRHAAQEMQEAIDMLEGMPGDDDQEWRAELIGSLQEKQTELNEKADEVEEKEEDEDEEEDEGLDDEEEDEAAAV